MLKTIRKRLLKINEGYCIKITNTINTFILMQCILRPLKKIPTVLVLVFSMQHKLHFSSENGKKKTKKEGSNEPLHKCLSLNASRTDFYFFSSFSASAAFFIRTPTNRLFILSTRNLAYALKFFISSVTLIISTDGFS